MIVAADAVVVVDADSSQYGVDPYGFLPCLRSVVALNVVNLIELIWSVNLLSNDMDLFVIIMININDNDSVWFNDKR